MPGAIGNANGVDLNSASEQELEQVGGLGRERARRIIDARPIRSWEEVRGIEGVSETLVKDLRQAGARISGERAA